MRKIFIVSVLIFNITKAFAQDTEGKFIKDSKTGCTVWFKHTFPEDSVAWSGGCENNFASGKGTLIGFTKGK